MIDFSSPPRVRELAKQAPAHAQLERSGRNRLHPETHFRFVVVGVVEADLVLDGLRAGHRYKADNESSGENEA